MQEERVVVVGRELTARGGGTAVFAVRAEAVVPRQRTRGARLDARVAQRDELLSNGSRGNVVEQVDEL